MTYAELGRRAAKATSARGGAVVDATFRHRADRDAFGGAFGDAAPLLFVECRAPARVLAERAAQRHREPSRVSDASLAVVVRESSAWEPLDELAPEAHVTLRSDRPVQAQLEDLRALLDRRVGQTSGAAERRRCLITCYRAKPPPEVLEPERFWQGNDRQTFSGGRGRKPTVVALSLST